MSIKSGAGAGGDESELGRGQHSISSLAERIVRQQEAIDGQNEAIQATLPGVGQVLNFTRSLQVKGDKGLQIVLQSDAPQGEFPTGKLWMLYLVLVELCLVRVVAPKND